MLDQIGFLTAIFSTASIGPSVDQRSEGLIIDERVEAESEQGAPEWWNEEQTGPPDS